MAARCSATGSPEPTSRPSVGRSHATSSTTRAALPCSVGRPVEVTVYLVGAGPGDPGLLTVRGAEVLRRADVVVYDRLSVEALLDLAPASAERISVGKAPGAVTMPQEQINALLVD